MKYTVIARNRDGQRVRVTTVDNEKEAQDEAMKYFGERELRDGLIRRYRSSVRLGGKRVEYENIYKDIVEVTTRTENDK